MGNRVCLELRGSDLPILVEEDEEHSAWLTSNNGLPLFWLALLREEDLGGPWEEGLRLAFADPEEFVMEPLRLDWRIARANLASARLRAEARLPELFPLLRAWEAGLLTLAGRGPAQELRLDLAEYMNFHENADSFLEELRRGVHLWHGDSQIGAPPMTDIGRDLTGFNGLTDEPFPHGSRVGPFQDHLGLPPGALDRCAPWKEPPNGAWFCSSWL